MPASPESIPARLCVHVIEDPSSLCSNGAKDPATGTFNRSNIASFDPAPYLYEHWRLVTGGFFGPFRAPNDDYLCPCCPDEYTDAFGAVIEPGYPNLDESGNYCLTEPCPAGTVWCETSNVCVIPTEPQCKEELNCEWDADFCNYVCDSPATICTEPGTFWQWSSCSCQSCPEGQCYCEQHGDCLVCPDAACEEELNCEWDMATCKWACDEPECPSGQEWDYDLCQCADCPPGEAWCEARGECVDQGPPPCPEVLTCTWSETRCDWDCEEPECPAGEVFSYETCECEPEGTGVDLLQDSLGWLYRSYRIPGGAVYVGRSRDGGATWEPFPVRTADQSAAATGAQINAVPTLCRDGQDHLYLWYHTEAGLLRCWRSRDAAVSWEEWTEFNDGNPYRFPRMIHAPEGALLVAHEDFIGLRGWWSRDFFLSERAEAFTFAAMPRQLVSLRVDRRGRVHLVWKDDDNTVKHRWSDNPAADDWQTSEDLGAGDYPVYAVGETHAMHLKLVPLPLSLVALQMFKTAASFGLPLTSQGQTTLAEDEWNQQQWMGTLVDRREHWWFAGRGPGAAGVVRTFKSEDEGRTWTEMGV